MPLYANHLLHIEGGLVEADYLLRLLVPVDRAQLLHERQLLLLDLDVLPEPLDVLLVLLAKADAVTEVVGSESGPVKRL